MSEVRDRWVIVTDGLWRKSISAIRALGAEGYKVAVMGDSWFTTGFYSRFTRKRFKCPTAATSEVQFLAGLEKLVSLCGGNPIILPMEDETIEAIYKWKGSASGRIRILLPEPASYFVARSKASTISRAHAMGLRVPKTEILNGAEAFESWRAGIPVEDREAWLIKPSKGSGSSGILAGSEIWKVASAERLRHDGPLLAQERLPQCGRGLGVSVLFNREGQCVMAFAHERLAEYPISGGPSTRRRAIENKELVALSTHLLQSLNWRGVAMVEWKIDVRSGDPVLMEINPRFWGSLELAVRSGFNFPVAYVRLCEGLPIAEPSAQEARPIVRWAVPGDILRYLSTPAGRRESILSFIRGVFSEGEEFDRRDIRGSIACVVCPFLFATKPRFWKYLRKR